jgi:hypothetical protein
VEAQVSNLIGPKGACRRTVKHGARNIRHYYHSRKSLAAVVISSYKFPESWQQVDRNFQPYRAGRVQTPR